MRKFIFMEVIMKYGEFDIFFNGIVCGNVSITQDKLFTVISASAKYTGDNIVRLAFSDGNAIKPLGVMLPRDGKFVFAKRYTKCELVHLGLDEACEYCLYDGTQSVPVAKDESWIACNHPEMYFEEENAGRAVAQCSDILCKVDGDFVYIAVPKSDEIDSREPVFYFAVDDKINGGDYLVLTLKNGKLQI